MKHDSFTTSSAAVRTDNSIASKEPVSVPRDFLLLCKDDNIAEAVHALYYLPRNYKLMVVADGGHSFESNAEWMETRSLKGRIRFEDMGNDQQASPYSFADAVISDESDAETAKSAAAPYVVVSTSAGKGISVDGIHGLTVQSGNPEALASAILHISRKK